jgi:hypothetical protein
MGTSSATQNTQTQTKTNPWEPTQGGLQKIVKGIGGEIPNYKTTAAEAGALNTISANAQAGNPYVSQIQSLASDLFGGGIDRTGMASDAYANYQKQAQPYLDPSYLDPSSNPAFKNYLSTISDDIQNRVNGMFAGAGRDLSGMNTQTLARGITEGTAPVFADQYNKNVATQRGLMDNMYSAGGQTAGLLSNLDQTALGNRAQGVGAAAEALGAQNYGAKSILEAEAMRRGLPLGNLQNLSSLLLPIAGAGSQTSGTATSTGTQTMSPLQQIAGWTSIAGGIPKAMTGVQSLGAIFSDRRLKEDIRPVGKLDNGLTVYSYRYAWGGPVHIGLMADEVQAVVPDAVGEVSGYKTVDYGIATEAA